MQLYCVKCEWCQGIEYVNNPSLRFFHDNCLVKQEYHLMKKTTFVDDKLVYEL